jgi:hypothetical protein
MLQKSELLICIGEWNIVAQRTLSPSLIAKGRVGYDYIGFVQLGYVISQCIAINNVCV